MKNDRFDYEKLPTPSLLINVTCDMRDKLYQIHEIKSRLISITVVDINDNMVFTDPDSVNVDIYHQESVFFEVR